MADEVKKSIKDEMNSTPSCIPAKWNRFTVADGDWMQAKTMDQLMNRDNFLADKIGEGNSAWKDALSSESATRYSDDQYLSASISSLSGEFYTFSADDYYPTVTALRYYLNSEIDRATLAESYLAGSISSEETARSAADTKLQKQIDKLQAATDVIAVFGTYDEFVAGSGDLGVTDNDTIKVLRDYNYTPSSADEDYDEEQQYDDDGFQVYYEWHDPDAEEPHTDWTGWSAIGSLDPYYSVAEIDEYLEQINDEVDSLSATVANNYLSAKGAVHPGKNIVVTEDSNKPEITISTSADVEFTNVSSTNISATNVTALTATGNSAKFTNISATNISADLFKTSNVGTVDTFNLKFSIANGASLTATDAKAITLTASTLYGQSNNSNVDSLIGSAQSGAAASAWINNTLFDFSYYEGTDPETAKGSIDKITILYKNDYASHNTMLNQEIIFNRGDYRVSGLLIQAAKDTDNGKVLTYNSTANNYTWQAIPNSTYTNVDGYISIDNTDRTINLSTSGIKTSAYSAEYISAGNHYFSMLNGEKLKFSYGQSTLDLSLTGVSYSTQSTHSSAKWDNLFKNYAEVNREKLSDSSLTADKVNFIVATGSTGTQPYKAVNFVVTSTLPSVLSADVYYII